MCGQLMEEILFIHIPSLILGDFLLVLNLRKVSKVNQVHRAKGLQSYYHFLHTWVKADIRDGDA